jgi:hypothetical protein
MHIHSPKFEDCRQKIVRPTTYSSGFFWTMIRGRSRSFGIEPNNGDNYKLTNALRQEEARTANIHAVLHLHVGENVTPVGDQRASKLFS